MLDKQHIELALHNFSCPGTDPDSEYNIIVSLTSYPARISQIHYTLYSLLQQSLRPNHVILWLAEERFSNWEADLPEKVLTLQKNGLEIRWTERDNSYQKLIPCLREYPNSIVVTADDDIFYDQDWLKLLYESYRVHEYAPMIYAHRVKRIALTESLGIAPYVHWDFTQTENPSYFHFPTGVGGILYPPHVLHPDIFNEELSATLAPHADDIFFWAMAVMSGTKIIPVQGGIREPLDVNPQWLREDSDVPALYVHNVLHGENDKQFHDVVVHYPDILEKLTAELNSSNFQSADYWENRYKNNGNSGAGSYNRLAEFKARVINAIVEEHAIERVIEFGCGDGNNLSLFSFKNYIGFDVSPTILEHTRQRFADDPGKSFFLLDCYAGQRAELTLSLDVIYHLVEDNIFDDYMRRLFSASEKYVIIYSSNKIADQWVKHVKHRKFTDWIEAYAKDFYLLDFIPNLYPAMGNGEDPTTSFADFYIFEKKSALAPQISIPQTSFSVHKPFQAIFDTIEVAVAISDPQGGYARHMGVCLYSFFANSSRAVRVHCLCDNSLREEDKRKCDAIAATFGHSIVYHDITRYLASFDFSVYASMGWSPAALGRLFLPDILPHIDRIIYLDIDTITDLDLTDMWEYPLAGHALGAVPDLGVARTRYIARYDFTSIPPFRIQALQRLTELDILHDHYFNTGSLLLDLKQLRQNRLFEQSLAFLLQNAPLLYIDNDALNAIFRDNYCKLPFRFNISVNVLPDWNHGPCIWHYAGSKPWNSNTARKDRYDHYLDLSKWDYSIEDTFVKSNGRKDFYIVNTDRDSVLSCLPKGLVTCEIGVQKGLFSEKIVNVMQPFRHHMIDPWAYQDDTAYKFDPACVPDNEQEILYNTVVKKFSHNSSCHLHRKTSLHAVNEFQDNYFDFIYIDGMHYYKQVLSDLNAYAPKMKKDGIICGHDYCTHHDAKIQQFGVVEAVSEFIRTSEYELYFLTNETWSSYFLARHDSKLMHAVLQTISLNFDIVNFPVLYKNNPDFLNNKNLICAQLIKAYQEQNNTTLSSELQHPTPERDDCSNIATPGQPVATLGASAAPDKSFMAYKVREYMLASFGKLDLTIIHDPAQVNGIREILKLLTPLRANQATKVRIGGPHDGGYVMLDPGTNGIAYSFGVSQYSPWDLEMANRGYRIFQYDGTIQLPPDVHENISFHRFNIASPEKAGPQEKTIGQIIQDHGHEHEQDIILQIDIEGAEWDFFESISDLEMEKFKQIILEIHNCQGLDSRQYAILAKINKSHAPIHVHYNNYCISHELLSFILPYMFFYSPVLEISYARRSDHSFSVCNDYFPTPLDSNNNKEWPDLPIGYFHALFGQ